MLLRNVTKCELLNDGVLADEKSRHFVFSCDKNGEFVDLQCNVDNGKCWCVNSDGITIDGTIVEGGRPNCTAESKLFTSIFFTDMHAT